MAFCFGGRFAVPSGLVGWVSSEIGPDRNIHATKARPGAHSRFGRAAIGVLRRAYVRWCGRRASWRAVGYVGGL